MSGIGEVAYKILMGWMRGLIDWFWRVVSGGSGDGLQWFLSKWKVWLVILLAGGLVIDWLMWLIRWRPYRVFLSRFRSGGKNAPVMEEAWDAGVGYYEPESMRDIEPSDWSDMTLGSLSETDPNWAEGVVIDTDGTRMTGQQAAASQNARENYYDKTYEDPTEAYQNAVQTSGYWEGDPDEAPGARDWQALPYDEEEPNRQVEPSPVLYKPYAEDEPGQQAETSYAFDQPYTEDEPTRAFPQSYGNEAPDASDQAASIEKEEYKEGYYLEEDDQPADQWAALSNYRPPDPPEEEAQYGRATMWPGAFPNVENYQAKDTRAQETEDSYHYYADEAFSDVDFQNDTDVENDPLFSANYKAEAPEKQSRMMRKLRRSDEDTSRRRSRQSKKEERQVSALEKTRPQRLVRAVPIVPEQNAPADFRTVTGKPVKRQGLFRLAAPDDEPIPGLPPLQIDDPFYPKAMPENPDFSDDDGDFR